MVPAVRAVQASTPSDVRAGAERADPDHSCYSETHQQEPYSNDLFQANEDYRFIRAALSLQRCDDFLARRSLGGGGNEAIAITITPYKRGAPKTR